MKATYTETRSNFANLWDRVIDEQEPLVVERRGCEDIVIIPASEYASLNETAHLLRSPKNAKRLLDALKASIEGEGTIASVDQLRSDIN